MVKAFVAMAAIIALLSVHAAEPGSKTPARNFALEMLIDVGDGPMQISAVVEEGTQASSTWGHADLGGRVLYRITAPFSAEWGDTAADVEVVILRKLGDQWHELARPYLQLFLGHGTTVRLNASGDQPAVVFSITATEQADSAKPAKQG